MNNKNKNVYILGSARIPFAKSQTVYKDISRQTLMTTALNHLVEQNSLQGKKIDDVAFGAIMTSAGDWNLSRECVLGSALHPETPAYNTQRACGTGLENTWQLCLKISAGHIETAIAGGVDTNSDVAIEVSEPFKKLLLKLNNARTTSERLKLFASFRPSFLVPKIPGVLEPRTKMSMGQHTELMVKEWNISREAQDELAAKSHQNAARAYKEGFFSDLVFPMGEIKVDQTLRGDTTVEKLAKLKPAFDFTESGTLTAGNSSPLTDGAATVLLGSEEAALSLGKKPLAQLIDVQVAAVDFVHGAGLLMAPTKAVAQLLQRNKLSFSDFDYIEIHEAFAGQVLCNMKAWETPEYCKNVLGLSSPLGAIDRTKLNVNGSSLATGHPFAATGARLVGSLAKLLSTGKKRGLISICTAGGMGIAAILESV
jgi:acetyl-CoA C-acetyltransferase